MINPKKFTNVGVVGFGAYIPKFRITVEEIAKVYEKDGKSVAASLGLNQKAVADRDEDTATLAVEAALLAISRSSKLKPENLGAVLIGSESHPYVVKPTGSIVAEVLGVGRDYLTADLEFACKAGTTAMTLIASLILGSKKYPWLAKLNTVSSFNSDTPDFWRREAEKYPAHAGRFTGEPAYFTHVVQGTKEYLQKFKQKISDFSHVVLHMPNAKFPQKAAARLGINREQLKTGFIVPEIGNPYSASAMTGLVKVLEEGKAGEKILVTSYGSGAGSDSFSLTIKRKNPINKKDDIKNQLKNVEQISYTKYLHFLGKA